MAQNLGDFLFRSVHPNDRDEMKALHEEFFPIRYNDNFYNEMVQGVGMHGGKLLSIVAEDRGTGRIAGFALFQMLKYPDQAEDSNLFAYPYPQYGCYILTLGVAPAYRMHGLASTLLSKCKDVAASDPECGALYLHVIHYNAAAIKLYTKNQFQFLRSMPDFYFFNETYFPAYLFAFYVNNHHAPGTSSGAESFFGVFSDWTTRSWEIVSEAVTQALFTSTASIADATRWIYQQFSPEVVAVSVAQISHHWLPTTAALLPGAEIPIEVASSSRIYPADPGPSAVAIDRDALASTPADGEMKV